MNARQSHLIPRSKINPFRPGLPAQPTLLGGRSEQIATLVRCLRQTRAGSPEHFAVVGERAIGKSSLLDYLAAVARGELPYEREQYRFLVIKLKINKQTDQVSLLRQIDADLVSHGQLLYPWFTRLWRSISEVAVGGFQVKKEASVVQMALERFAQRMSTAVTRLRARKKDRFEGVLVLIDEVDAAPAEADLGTFLKLLIEALGGAPGNHVTFGLAGLPVLGERLTSSHPSAVRGFTKVSLPRLSRLETGEAVEKAIGYASSVNHEEYSVDEGALNLLFDLSEGLPYHLQQCAYCAFERNRDSVISAQDVHNGLPGPDGALERIGTYYEELVGWSRRTMLERRIMSALAGINDWATVTALSSEMNERSEETAATLDHLQQEGLVDFEQSSEGLYRLQSEGLSNWLRNLPGQI
jgi:hypothetical protein